jgi:uncharacterized membrane protein
LRSGSNRWLVAAVLVGFLLRLGWVLWTSHPPSSGLVDQGRFLSAAQDLAHGHLPQWHGVDGMLDPPRPSSGIAVGYPLVLTPVVWLAERFGTSESFAAALANVALSTANVVLVAALASRWISRRARNPAAWLMALAPSHVYFTAVAMSETTYTTAVLGGVLLGGDLVRRRNGEALSKRAAVGFGVYGAWAGLVNPGGWVLILVPVLSALAERVPWRLALRRSGWVVVGLLVLLVPWTVRNGVQTDLWTPAPGSNAIPICYGHNDHSTGGDPIQDPYVIARCYLGEPPRPGETADEALTRFLSSDTDDTDLYYRNNREALQWALHHPGREVHLAVSKLWITLRGDSQSLYLVLGDGESPITDGQLVDRLAFAADAWHLSILALSAVALALVPAARRATPVWAIVLLNLVGVIAFHGEQRFHVTSIALLVVLASGGILATKDAVAHRRRSWARAATARAAPREAPDAEPVEVGALLAAATRPAGVWAGPHGHPFHPVLAAVAIGAWVFSFGFDCASRLADEAWMYARGAYVLTATGVGVGILAATVGLADLVRVHRGTPAFRVGIRHLLSMLLALAVFTISFLLRRTADFAPQDAVALLPTVLSVIGLGVVAVGVWHGQRLAYGYGVRVALEEDRRQGFETAP